MLSIRRLAVTAATIAALAAPTAAQARPDIAPGARHTVTTDAAVPPQKTEIVATDSGFDWGDAGVGAAAALLISVALGGAALSVRPGRVSA